MFLQSLNIPSIPDHVAQAFKVHGLTTAQLRATQATGALLLVTIRGLGATFRIKAATPGGDATLITNRERTPREFANPIKACSLLRERGIRAYRAEIKNWRPEDSEFDQRVRRPDRAQALHASHEAWLASKLQRALVDPRSNVAHEAVMAEADAIISAAEAKQQRAV